MRTFLSTALAGAGAAWVLSSAAFPETARLIVARVQHRVGDASLIGDPMRLGRRLYAFVSFALAFIAFAYSGDAALCASALLVLQTLAPPKNAGG